MLVWQYWYGCKQTQIMTNHQHKQNLNSNKKKRSFSLLIYNIGGASMNASHTGCASSNVSDLYLPVPF